MGYINLTLEGENFTLDTEGLTYGEAFQMLSQAMNQIQEQAELLYALGEEDDE